MNTQAPCDEAIQAGEGWEAKAVVLFLLWLLVNRTDMGQQIQAVGGNVEAAWQLHSTTSR
jgi:hypothetical protein